LISQTGCWGQVGAELFWLYFSDFYLDFKEMVGRFFPVMGITTQARYVLLQGTKGTAK